MLHSALALTPVSSLVRNHASHLRAEVLEIGLELRGLSATSDRASNTTEDDDMIRQRVKLFYNELVNEHKNENHVVLLAAHKCICNVLIQLMTDMPRDMQDDFGMGKLATCSEDGEIIWIN